MEFDEVATLLHRLPFVPIQVRLDDGEKFMIATPFRAIASEGKLLVGWSKDPYAPPEKRQLRIIPVARVRTIEDIDPRKLSRRKTK